MQWEDLRSPLNLDSNPPSLLISPMPFNMMSPPSVQFSSIQGHYLLPSAVQGLRAGLGQAAFFRLTGEVPGISTFMFLSWFPRL